ncbi:MAG: nitrite/sulfite reductase, partial [Candidatus Methylomirabilis sp.]|nr:nitrite/sulfite reductase [Deltaproteobacteria bacterium]
RQDIQFHWVPLERVAALMDALDKLGFTTREACGNTVRNVTCEAYAGVHPDEAFDATPYSFACANYFLRNAICQALPRKFKITFTGRPGGAGYPGLHDIAMIAEVREHEGKPTRGFKIYAGGGLGSSPRPARLVEDWVPANRFLPCCEALVRLFDEHGNRDNRNRARMKFVLEKLGYEAFLDLYKSYRDKLLALGERPEWTVEPGPDIALPPVSGALPKGNGHAGYAEFARLNAVAQKQKGYYAVTIKLTLGDITSAEIRKLCDVLEKFPTVDLRVSQDQNLLVRHVPQDRLDELYDGLVAIGLADPGAETLADVICCPGAETCNLGITASRGLAAYLTDEFTTRAPKYEKLRDLRIKVSGCPNSCGHHHVADIGFHGAAKRVQGRLVPHYEVFLGGDPTLELIQFSEPSGKIPAKNAPALVHAITDRYLADKKDGEKFGAWVRRIGKEEVRAILKPFTEIASFEEASFKYTDWNAETPFALNDRGQGECAGKLIDLIEGRLIDAERALFQGILQAEKGKAEEALLQADRAIVGAVRAILSTEGLDLTTDEESVAKFESLILDMEIIPSKFAGLLQSVGLATEDQARERIEEARLFIQACASAYRAMREAGNLRLRTGFLQTGHEAGAGV